MADFASRLRELRKERSYRQADLATELGVAQTTVANYEQHTRFPDETMLLRIANLFGVSLDYLLGRTDISVAPASAAAAKHASNPDPASLTENAREYLDLLLEARHEKAFSVVLDAAESGTSLEEIYESIIAPALHVVGTLWASGEIGIAVEHYISSATETLMGRLHRYVETPGTNRGAVVLVAAGGERHVIGLRMVSDLLERAGWHVHHLGGNLPAANVRAAVTTLGARILAVSATMAEHIDSVAELIRSIRAEQKRGSRPLSIVVGGLPFNLDHGLWKRIGADGFAPTAADAVLVIDRLATQS
jgi:MerR family transcriptional regulator, light-induced transcriptional regulator